MIGEFFFSEVLVVVLKREELGICFVALKYNHQLQFLQLRIVVSCCVYIYILWVLQYRVFFLGIIGIIGCGSPTFFYGAWEGALCYFGSIKASFEPACLWPHMHSIFWGRWRHQCCSHEIVLLLWINVMTSMLYCCWFYWYFYRDWVLGELTI